MVGTATEWNNYSLMSQMINDTTCTVEAPINDCMDKERRVPRFDDVERPSHYNKGGIEAIQYIRQQLGPIGVMFYSEGNSLKYGHRWRYKSPVKDLGKKEVYSKWMREEIEKLHTKEGRQAWLTQLDELRSFVESFK